MEDAISEYRRALLARSPLETPLLFSSPIETEALDAVERDLVTHLKLEGGDIRVAAALGYYRLPSDVLLSFASKHATEMLEEELKGLPEFSFRDPERELFSCIDRSSASNIVEAVPGSGWFIGVCSLLSQAKSEAIFSVVGTPIDHSNVALAYVASTFVPDRLRIDVIDRLVRANHGFRKIAALGLTYEWIVEALSGSRDVDIATIEAFLCAPTPWRNRAFGDLLKRVIFWIETRPFSVDRYQRAVDALLKLVAALKMTPGLRPRDIEAVLDGAGSRGACVLAAMAHWTHEPDKASPDLVAAVQSGGVTTLRRLFGSSMNLSEEAAQESYLDLQPLLRPLITAFDRLGIDRELLRTLYGGLSADRYSYDHRRSFWRRDRPRALSLLAVAAAVARDREDYALAKVVEQLAKIATLQPTARMPAMVLNFAELLNGVNFHIPNA